MSKYYALPRQETHFHTVIPLPEVAEKLSERKLKETTEERQERLYSERMRTTYDQRLNEGFRMLQND